MRRNFIFFLFLTSVAQPFGTAQGPTLAFSDPAAMPFIVRMQRARYEKNECAIVRGDGLFHLEVETFSGIDIEEGTLTKDELASLRILLGDRGLATLKQKDIQVPLINDGRDVFQLDMLRSPFTQDLSFPNQESREPFAAALDPLLHWIDKLPKHPHRTLEEFSGRNNCIVPHPIKFSVRRPEASSRAEPAPAKSQTPAPGAETTALPAQAVPSVTFLMRWNDNRIANGVVENTCIVISPAGTFRMEKMRQAYHEKLTVRGVEASLTDGQLQDLKVLLNDPSLKSCIHDKFSIGQSILEAKLTALAISRPDGVQQLRFSDYVEVLENTLHTKSHVDHQEEVLKPLRAWLKNQFDHQKLNPIPGNEANRCLGPSQQDSQ